MRQGGNILDGPGIPEKGLRELNRGGRGGGGRGSWHGLQELGRGASRPREI